MTVGELKKLMKDVPDDTKVELASDTGVDQGSEGIIVVEQAFYSRNIFYIYCNEREWKYADTSDSEI